MSTKAYKQPVGEIRPSHLLHTFGVGAVVDLPNLSTMVMGLEDWSRHDCVEIREPRLLAKVRKHLGPQIESLLAPPRQEEAAVFNPVANGAPVGVPVAPFPRWLRCPHCNTLAPIESGLFTLKRNPNRPERTHYEHSNCRKVGKPPAVLPARFLAACERGHLDEFPWSYFVHKGKTGCPARLTLIERGGTGESYDVFVKCETCDAQRPMGEAFGKEGKNSLPQCRGRHPHLRDFDETPCPEQVKPILLGASNSWFGITLRALAIPEAEDRLGALIDQVWPLLEEEHDPSILRVLRKTNDFRPLASFNDAEIWGAVERKRAGTQATHIHDDLLVPEWEILINPKSAPNTDDFRVKEVAPPSHYAHLLTRVVLVERLREVRTLIGFTRIDSPGDFTDPGEIPPVQRAPMTRTQPKWVPATDVRGEGIFIQFDEQAIETWLERNPELIAHEEAFLRAHIQWRRARGIPEPAAHYPGLRYVLLHSFAHALMRELSLECGYSMASLAERIYARDTSDPNGPMAGILIYTSAADSEGTLGGLVHLGRPETLGRHIMATLAHVEICASDPHCAEHRVTAVDNSLHGASCHACLFAPESCCERNNRYLDRSVLIPTVERTELAFFGVTT